MEASETSVFVDSNFLIAFFNTEDSLHLKAVAQGRTLTSLSVRLVMSNLIFLETVTVLSQRAGRLTACRAGQYILHDPLVRMVQVDELLQEETWQLFQTVERKDTSFVDCSTLAVMRAENIKTLLTFDHADFTPLQKRFRFKFFESKGTGVKV